jgi:hypothetical protein
LKGVLKLPVQLKTDNFFITRFYEEQERPCNVEFFSLTIIIMSRSSYEIFFCAEKLNGS